MTRRPTAATPSPLPQQLLDILSTPRPDLSTWRQLCRVVDELTPSGVDVAAIAERLKTWPRELPRPAPKEWIQQRCDAHGDRTIFFDYLDALCLHVVENEALYNHYITTISSHPRLRGDDGMPIVSMWRQPRGVVTLQGGGQMTLGAGQPGLADLGGVMTVTWLGSPISPPDIGDRYVAHALNLYVEVEVKTDGNIPPLAVEYRGASKRALTPTESDQVARQQAQLRRGGCYIFAERTEEAVDALCRYRDDVMSR